MRPPLVRLINAIGPIWKAIRVGYPSIDPDVLLKKAMRKTGLDDLGTEDYKEALSVLIQSINESNNFNHTGQFITSSLLYNSFENRLRLTETFKQNPEINNEKIERPIFILGLPRTGTTLLHYLLDQDDNHRSAKTWEAFHPHPYPKKESYTKDRRIRRTRWELFLFWNLIPNIKVIHDFDESTAQECIVFMSHTFISFALSTQLYIPRYMKWLQKADLGKLYAEHKKMLQYYQFGGVKSKRWLLKAPAHLYCVEAILSAYPDACIIQTHRDPLKAVASSCSLNYALAQVTVDDLSLDDVGVLHRDTLSDWLKMNVVQRQKLTHKSDQFYDLSFSDFVSDPISEIKKIYRHFEFEFDDALASKMNNFMEENPSGKHGKHIYSIEQFGLDRARDTPLFTEYIDYFKDKLK